MPRNGSGVYSAPAGTLGTPNTVIESAKYNAFVNDLVSDANAARPVTAGGTGGTSQTTAQSGLGVDGKVVHAAKSAGYTAVAADNNAYLRFTAGATLALTAAATLGANWHCFVQANGGAVVIDPNGAETVNGASTVTLVDGQSAMLICTGSAFFAYIIPGLAASNTWSASQTLSNGAAFGAAATFGSTFVASASDLSKHLSLYSNTYGISVTAGVQNYVVPAGGDHKFYQGTTEIGRFNSGGLTMPVNLGISFSGTGAATTRTNLGFGTGSVVTLTGTSVDITGIPSGVRRISFPFANASTSGTTGFSLQLGTSSGIETSGYKNGTSSGNSTTEFPLTGGTSAAAGDYQGIVTLELLNSSTNLWSVTAVNGRSDTSAALVMGGSKALAGTLDRVRFKTGNGVETFDAGSVSMSYQ